jgi:hypothetical protein
MKRYIPVGNVERRTSHCPTYIAWRVIDEARDALRQPIPDAYAAQLARRAEGVMAHHPFWEKKYRSPAGRDVLLMTMRHWLAAVLAREQPALFCALPDSFKAGVRLPPRHVPRPKATRKSPRGSRPAPFVHGENFFDVLIA